MARLAIKGHATRGKEVIEILEMLGGINPYVCKAVRETCFYFIVEGEIDYDEERYITDEYTIFTLEEFLEKYPYKVGDKVIAYAEGCLAHFTIQGMRWNYESNKVEYKICSSWYDANLIQSYKEEKKETMEENPDTALALDLKLKGEDYSNRRFCYKIPNGYEIDCVRENEIILKPIKPQYPKTYEECHELMVQWKEYDCNPNSELILCEAPIHDFCKLIVARNIYWKIAGEEMGLGKPWEPAIQDTIWGITRSKDEIEKYSYRYGKTKLLEFPTEEMRDAFYENFKDLIVLVKELL